MNLMSATPALAAAQIQPKLAELRKATDQLQTNFVENLVKEMRQDSDDEFGDMAGSDVYSGMVNQALAQSISKNSKLGISDMLYGQLSKKAISQQEGLMLKLADQGKIQGQVKSAAQNEPTISVQPLQPASKSMPNALPSETIKP